MDTYSELVADTVPAAGSVQPDVRYEPGSRLDWVRIPIPALFERRQEAAAAS